MSAANGRFVWFDLMTTDIAGAKSFYGDIAGWKTAAHSSDYEMWCAGEEMVGGIMPHPAGENIPPHWLGYVDVKDIDESVKRAQHLGGKVLVPGTDIPEIGRFAVLADPQGAAFAVYSSSNPDAGGGEPSRGPGHYSWAELNTTDWKAAWAFYSELFGWKTTSTMDMGPEFGTYHMFGTDSKKPSMGGMSNAASTYMQHAPPHWLHYITVRDADETARRIVEKGGKILNGPTDVPGGGRIAQCVDPQGAAFAIYAETEA